MVMNSTRVVAMPTTGPLVGTPRAPHSYEPITMRQSLPQVVGQHGSAGTVFSDKSAAYMNLNDRDLACVLIRECVGGAATLYSDHSNQFMRPNGVTVVDLSLMDAQGIEEVLLCARENNVKLDFHATWLSTSTNGVFHYPNPMTDPIMFEKLTELVSEHVRLLGEKPQITIHMTGATNDWKAWVDTISAHAQILVENSFEMRLSPEEQTAKNIKSAFEYFLHSDFHAPEDFVAWVKELGLAVCFDQAHAFGGYRHARNDGLFDAIGDLKYLKMLMEQGLEIGRLHRASVPRELAGQERKGRPLNAIDAHGALTPFTRQWFLVNYSA